MKQFADVATETDSVSEAPVKVFVNLGHNQNPETFPLVCGCKRDLGAHFFILIQQLAAWSIKFTGFQVNFTLKIASQINS